MADYPTTAEIRARLDRAKAMRFATGINPAVGVYATDTERDLYQLAGRCWNALQAAIKDLDLYVGHEPTITEEALYVHEQQVRARIAQDVNRAERPTFADGERPELVVRTTRAIDIRLIEHGDQAPYYVAPEAGA